MSAPRDIFVGDFVHQGNVLGAFEGPRVEVRIGWATHHLTRSEAEALANALAVAVLDLDLREAGAEPIGPEPMSATERADWGGGF